MGLISKGSKSILLNKAKYLADKGEEYTIKVVNGNYELMSDLFNHKTINKTTYSPSELQFIRAVKNYIVKQDIHLLPQFEKQYFAEDVHYIKVAHVPIGEVFTNVYEVDIDEAYWKTAHLLGVINDKIYQRGQKGNISKQARLTALGTLAKKVYLYQFKGNKLEKVNTETDPLLQNLWFTICKRVSDVMNECIRAMGKDFIFYWVDGIYFNKNDKKEAQIKDFLNKKGFGYSEDTLTGLKSEFTGDGYQFSYQKNKKEKSIYIPAFSNPHQIRKKIAIADYNHESTIKNFENLVEKYYI